MQVFWNYCFSSVCLLHRDADWGCREFRWFPTGYRACDLSQLFAVLCLVAQLCATLWDAMDRSPPGSSLCPWGFSRQEFWSELPCPPPGDFLNPGMELRSPAFQADSLPSEPARKPKNTGVVSLSLLQQIFLTQQSNQSLLHCRWILYQLSYQGSPFRDIKQGTKIPWSKGI